MVFINLKFPKIIKAISSTTSTFIKTLPNNKNSPVPIQIKDADVLPSGNKLFSSLSIY